MSHPSAQAQGHQGTLARLGGDEFIVLLDDLDRPSDVFSVVERIQRSLARPFQVDGREIYTTASIGVATSATAYSSAEDVLRDADIAMYRAKTLGRARCEIYDEAMHAAALKRFSIEGDLRRALQTNEFILYYQPIVSLTTGRVARFEALVRWRKGGDALVYPGDFIPVAEESGLIVPLGAWVLREACRVIDAWRDRTPHTTKVLRWP